MCDNELFLYRQVKKSNSSYQTLLHNFPPLLWHSFSPVPFPKLPSLIDFYVDMSLIQFICILLPGLYWMQLLLCLSRSIMIHVTTSILGHIMYLYHLHYATFIVNMLTVKIWKYIHVYCYKIVLSSFCIQWKFCTPNHTFNEILWFFFGGGGDILLVFIENVLCNFAGHVHITDFNIATLITDNQLATSMSGTTPYMGRFWKKWNFTAYL